MSCNIIWNSLNFSEWNSRFRKVYKANITQDCDYARAICPLYGQNPRWGLVFIDNQEAGLCQIQEAGILNNAFHAVIMDRGPLWFDGFGSEDHFEAFVKAFNHEFPRRFGRKRRFIPEVEDSPRIQEILSRSGFRKTIATNYKTIWVDLSPDVKSLRAGLKMTWRRALSRAERSNITITWDDQGRDLAWLLKYYEMDKNARNYPGPDPKIIRALAKTLVPKKAMMIGAAHLEGSRIAGILLLCHGKSATYQIGWTLPEGRANNAHRLLLWEGLQKLKAKGITFLDLGGIYDGAPGLKAFKEGMGGQIVTLPGAYT